ncbi:Hypothetical protein A7982_06414 [Minicystis rosea]|nr:Hypothetical protein A7982_06414 [Minicystis rosea]
MKRWSSNDRRPSHRLPAPRLAPRVRRASALGRTPRRRRRRYRTGLLTHRSNRRRRGRRRLGRLGLLGRRRGRGVLGCDGRRDEDARCDHSGSRPRGRGHAHD